eukprot:3496449-Prymnesium_polylepis.2
MDKDSPQLTVVSTVALVCAHTKTHRHRRQRTICTHRLKCGTGASRDQAPPWVVLLARLGRGLPLLALSHRVAQPHQLARRSLGQRHLAHLLGRVAHAVPAVGRERAERGGVARVLERALGRALLVLVPRVPRAFQVRGAAADKRAVEPPDACRRDALVLVLLGLARES